MTSTGDDRSPLAGVSGSLRRRLFVALVATSVGSVALAGLITILLGRPAQQSAAIADLRRALQTLADTSEPPRIALKQLKARLGATDIGVVAVLPNGRIVPTTAAGSRAGTLAVLRALPSGVRVSDLQGPSLAGGTVQSGVRGSIVFVAQPLAARAAETLVVVATRRIGVVTLGPLARVLLLAAIAAAMAAAGLSLPLARRLTRPLGEMKRTALAIAAGDLSARVRGQAGADHELSVLAAAIDTMAEELQRQKGLDRAFLMSVSHDLRTPLTSIRGYATALADGTADDEESRAIAAQIIEAEARRFERLIADLLDLARLDAREFSLNIAPVDVEHLAGQAALALGPAAADAEVTINFTPGAGPCFAQADPDRLRQVIANLLENALKYAARTVEVRVEATGAHVQLAITDDGPGIDQTDLPHVFERLYTSRTQSGRKIGTGLGLAIVAQLVAAMGGAVRVTSAGDNGHSGTRFVVELERIYIAPSTGDSDEDFRRTT